MASAAPASRRARPAKSPLTREVIVRTGLAVLDRDGIDALTMRRVAQELDTGAASLYVYVAHRDDLLTAMLDEALADLPAPAATGPWRERLTGLVEATVAAMSRHQGLALVALASLHLEPNALLVVDRMIGLLKEGGLDDATVAWSVDLLYLHITATAAEESAHLARNDTEAGVIADAAERLASVPAERYPMVVALREHLLAGHGDARARWGMTVLLNGILATPAG